MTRGLRRPGRCLIFPGASPSGPRARAFPTRGFGRLARAGPTAARGWRYYGDGVLGYDSARNNQPLLGGGYTLASALLGRDWSLQKGRRLRLQLNVDNALNETDPIVTDTDQSEDYRYVLQTPRRYGLSATLSF